MNLLVLEQLTISDSQKSLIQTKNPRNSHLFFISNETTPQVIPEFITYETPTPRETRGWRHLVFILRSTTP